MNQHHYHYPKNNHVAPTEASTTMQSDFDDYDIVPDIHQAVFVNNEGTKLVRQCQYDTAVQSFAAVLKILKPLAALVEANGHFEAVDISNDECIPMSTSFANNATPQSMSRRNNNDEQTNMNLDNINELRQSESESSEDETERQSSTVSQQEYCNGGLSPTTSNSRSQKARRLSAAAATKLLAASGPSNKYARRKMSHFVFRDPVEIPPESVPSSLMVEADGGHSSELFSKFLMIVMYNLALTLHLHALSLSNLHRNQKTNLLYGDKSDGKKARRLFLRSRKLYELAFEMHLEESCDVNLLFTLALINNLGLVYDVLDQKERSKTCFKNMFSTMMYLMDSNESHTVKEWDGLLSNVMDILFQQHREIAAPAA